MKKTINTEHIEGYVYSHKLEIKTVSNQASANYGKSFISGTLDIATDDDCMNVIPVHFTYVTETTKDGRENATYKILSEIINGGKTVLANGKDEAKKVSVNASLRLNDYYNQNGELVSLKQNEGSFVNNVTVLRDENERNTFEADMLITGVTRVEKEDSDDYCVVKGAIFNFRNDLLPVEFSIRNPEGMKYFEDLGITNAEPIFTKVWGKIQNLVTIKTVTEESAFGEAAVKTTRSTDRDWTITASAKIPYDFGDEKIITAEDIKKAVQDRETMLAEVKARREEYDKQKTTTTPNSITSAIPKATTTGTFNF